MALTFATFCFPESSTEGPDWGARGREGRSDEERLLQNIFNNYNPSARPVINSSETVFVQMQFSLMHIKELVSSTLGYILLYSYWEYLRK